MNEEGSRRAGQDEVFEPFPVPRGQLHLPTHVRSTLLASSLRALREHGFFDDYLAHLDPRWRETILDSVAGVWLPAESSVAHYRACDALPLTRLQRIALGREVGDRVNGTFLGTMVRAAKTAGATPWGVLAYTNRLYARHLRWRRVLRVEDGAEGRATRGGQQSAPADRILSRRGLGHVGSGDGTVLHQGVPQRDRPHRYVDQGEDLVGVVIRRDPRCDDDGRLTKVPA